MCEAFQTKFHSEDEDQEIRNPTSYNEIQSISSFTDTNEKKNYLDPPIDLPKRSYSLEPDMANGWKPKKSCKITLNNVFSINYDQYVVDQIVKELYKNKKKYRETLVYLGPRKNNSYILHEERKYPNPYPIDKKLDELFSARSGIPQNAKLADSSFKFESDFQCGNLDVAIKRSNDQFDLFMRVDTNTRGHTNWYYFEISNGDYIGTVKFNICNFRREKSLYQRGLKPYVSSKLQEGQWHQAGKNVKYEKIRLKYDFLYDEEQDFSFIEDQAHI